MSASISARVISGAGWGLYAALWDVILTKDKDDKHELYTGAAHWVVGGMLIPFVKFGPMVEAWKAVLVGAFSSSALLMKDWNTDNSFGSAFPFCLGMGAFLGFGTLFTPPIVGYGVGLGSLTYLAIPKST